MTKLHIFLGTLLLASMGCVQASWNTVRQFDAADDTENADLLTYDQILEKANGFKKSKKQSPETNTQIFTSVTGEYPSLVRKTYTFDVENQFVSYLEEKIVPAKSRDVKAGSPAKIRNSKEQESPRKATRKLDTKHKEEAEKPGIFEKQAEPKAAAPAASAAGPAAPKLNIDTNTIDMSAKAIKISPANDSSKPKRSRSFHTRYYKHALFCVGVLGIMWQIRSNIEKRRIEREKSALAA